MASTVLAALTGVGIASATVRSNSTAQLSVQHKYIGVAMGLLTTFRYVGGSIGTTLYGANLNNELGEHLGPNVAKALANAGTSPADIPAIVAALAAGETTSPALANASPAALAAATLALQDTYSNTFELVFLVSIAFGVFGIVCAAFSKNIGEFLTDELDEKLDHTVHLRNRDVGQGRDVMEQGEPIQAFEKI